MSRVYLRLPGVLTTDQMVDLIHQVDELEASEYLQGYQHGRAAMHMEHTALMREANPYMAAPHIPGITSDAPEVVHETTHRLHSHLEQVIRNLVERMDRLDRRTEYLECRIQGTINDLSPTVRANLQHDPGFVERRST